jgi:hypothetical protein
MQHQVHCCTKWALTFQCPQRLYATGRLTSPHACPDTTPTCMRKYMRIRRQVAHHGAKRALQEAPRLPLAVHPAVPMLQAPCMPARQSQPHHLKSCPRSIKATSTSIRDAVTASAALSTVLHTPLCPCSRCTPALKQPQKQARARNGLKIAMSKQLRGTQHIPAHSCARVQGAPQRSCKSPNRQGDKTNAEPSNTEGALRWSAAATGDRYKTDISYCKRTAFPLQAEAVCTAVKAGACAAAAQTSP